jgi:hypothetical protein
MQPEKLTLKSQEALSEAQRLARRHKVQGASDACVTAVV